MKSSCKFTLASRMAAIAVVVSNVTTSAQERSALVPAVDWEWKKLPSIPDKRGFGSPYAGVAGGALVVAGGANFPNAPPWEGGVKVWYDGVFVLDRPDGAWKKVGRLSRPMAGGVAITTAEGVACLGGGDADRCYDSCFMLKYEGGRVEIKPLPKLPKPCVNAAGVRAGNMLYVSGGIERPDAETTLKTFWSLDLDKPSVGWRDLEIWPGPGRLLATMGALDGAVYLFSGADLKPGAGKDGKPERVWLTDAYQYRLGHGWQKLANLPRVAVAAPGPAPSDGASMLVLGGDDGAQVRTPPTSHVGFRRDVLAYNPGTNVWSNAGELPAAIVTSAAVRWGDLMVVPGGEVRPGVRTTDVWAAKLQP